MIYKGSCHCDEQEIRQLVTNWAEATKTGDIPAVLRAGHTLSIQCKQGGKWVLARDANMLAPVQNQGK